MILLTDNVYLNLFYLFSIVCIALIVRETTIRHFEILNCLYQDWDLIYIGLEILLKEYLRILIFFASHKYNAEIDSGEIVDASRDTKRNLLKRRTIICKFWRI